MDKPLSGITVVEFSTFVAAPVTARLLGDLGARVIKVEHPKGDAWRQTGISFLPSRFSPQENPVFDIYNAGKEHITLNLKTPEGMEAFHRLLSKADVLVTNTRPAALKRLQLSYRDLKDRYPSLIYAMVVGYGENGPDAAKPAYDTSAFWSKCGFIRDQALRQDDYQPIPPPSSMGDTVTGYLLVAEICAALLRKEKTGKGDLVRSGLYHNGIFTMGTMVITSQPGFGRVYPEDRAGWNPNSGAFQCADGEWIYLSGYSPSAYPILYRMLEREDLGDDPRFADVGGRWQNRHAYYEEIRKSFLARTSDEWLALAQEYDLPLVRIGSYRGISSDEQAWANDYLETVTFANGRTEVMPSSPIEMESVGKLHTVPAPEIGADNARLLAELGYTEEEINHLTKKKV